MTTVTIDDEKLTITVEGLDRLLAFKGHVTIPLAHVQKAEHYVGGFMDAHHAAFGIGTIFAGKIQAGTFKEDNEKSFWDVRNPKDAMLITLKDDEYNKLIVEVEDTEEVIKQIQERIK